MRLPGFRRVRARLRAPLLASAWAATCLGVGLRSLAGEAGAGAVAVPPTALEFAGLAHYAAANRALPPATPGEARVVFLGDSITQSWGDFQRDYFARSDRINRGIGGQATPQMLLRFRQDVIALKPAMVHILAGTNDIAGNVGPMDLETIESNIASMVELARAHGVAVLLGSVPPASDFPWRPGLDPGPKIVALNDWLKRYARDQHLIFIDYYSALTDGALGMRPALALDGVHPSLEGYRVMLPLAEAGIAAALRHGTQRR
jgi:acyl-CoA thioesterase I